MGEKLHRFEGRDIRVTWSKTRCIHAAECVLGLPRVFEPGRSPWVMPDDADAGRIAEVVMRCPTGALHFERRDGGAAEPVPETNTIGPSRGGPLIARGDLEILDPGGTVLLRETRVALCRCGQSLHKPFCDNHHRDAGFADRGEVFEGGLKPGASGTADRRLRITLQADGPLRLEGPVTVRSADGRVELRGGQASLCRCGQSRTKPFCDGSHVAAGFRSGPGASPGA